MEDQNLSPDNALILELTTFILAFISGLFTVYSLFRLIKICKEGFTKIVRTFFTLITVASLLRFTLFMGLGFLVMNNNQDIVIKTDSKVINRSLVSNALSLVWVFPDIFPLLCYVFLMVIWIQVLYGGFADFRPQTFRNQDPVNYVFAMLQVFGFSLLQLIFCVLFICQIISLRDLQLQIALVTLIVVALTLISMLILCLKFSGIPYRSHIMVNNLKCLLYVIMLWGTARIIYGILTLAYPDTIQSNPDILGVIISMIAEYIALELIPYLIALDSKSINALALKQDSTMLIQHEDKQEGLEPDAAEECEVHSGSHNDMIQADTDSDYKMKGSAHAVMPERRSFHSTPGNCSMQQRFERFDEEEKKDQRSSLKEVMTYNPAGVMTPRLTVTTHYNKGSAGVGFLKGRSAIASFDSEKTLTEIHLSSAATQISVLEMKRIKRDFFINQNELELLDQIKEKRSKFSLGKVFNARYRGQHVICRIIAPLHATNWLIEDFCKDAAVFIKMGRILPILHILGYGEKKGKLYILTPKSRSLHTYLHKEKPQLSIENKLHLILKLAQVLRILHLGGNFHGHLSSFNVFIEENDENVLIGDLNMMKVKKNAIIFDGYRIKNVWSPPEVFSSNWSDVIGPYVDIYSFGLISWQASYTLRQILTGAVPFDNKVNKAAQFVMKENKRPMIPEDVPDVIRDIIRACWNSNRELRPHFESIIAKLDEHLFS